MGYYASAVGIITALLTSIYSWRLIFKTFHGRYNNKENTFNSLSESSLTMILPSCLLAIGAIFAGVLFKELFIGHENFQIWGNSILF